MVGFSNGGRMDAAVEVGFAASVRSTSSFRIVEKVTGEIKNRFSLSTHFRTPLLVVRHTMGFASAGPINTGSIHKKNDGLYHRIGVTQTIQDMVINAVLVNALFQDTAISLSWEGFQLILPPERNPKIKAV